jgi:hypothetical protein
MSSSPERAPGSDTDLVETARLLRSVFPIPRFDTPRYLEWFYRRNPVGRAIEIDRRDGSTRIGHVAGIPQEYHCAVGSKMSVFPLNVAVAPSGRGRGLMIEMNQACFDEAARRYGIEMVVAMPNAASTRGYTGRLGFRFVKELPVVLCPFAWPAVTRVVSRRVTAEYLTSSEFDALTAGLDVLPGAAWSHRWTRELLRWRLSAPGAEYFVHASARVVIVTCVERRAGIRIAVVLKTFRRVRGEVVSANATIAAACRFHRAPVGLYAGFSTATRVVGVPLPDRLRPAPLNLCVRTLRGGAENADLHLDTFELFDFDAF